MTKQEIISQSYSNCWEQVKDFVDDNGICSDNVYGKIDCPRPKECGFLIKEVTCGYKYKDDGERQVQCFNWRPLSLEGIEDNNGWIKLESEADLPKENSNCLLIEKTSGHTDMCPFDNSSFDKKHFIKYFSHYQIIKIPKLPIY